MLDPVPRANPINMISHHGSSSHSNGTIDAEATIHSIKLNAILIVATNFHANSSYAGFVKFTIDVITVAHAIAAIISVDICIIDRI